MVTGKSILFPVEKTEVPVKYFALTVFFSVVNIKS
jgi:hypothetical protein